MFAPPTPPPLTIFPELRERWKDAPEFLRDSRFDFNFRSYYRDEVTNAPNSVGIKEAWAAGGSVSAETGKLFDLVKLGAVLYTSFPVVAPPQYGNTGLLLPNQQGYAVFGQLYGQVNLFESHNITLGRYLYDTPFLGPHDNRMTPNTFSGYTITGTFGSGEKRHAQIPLRRRLDRRDQAARFVRVPVDGQQGGRPELEFRCRHRGRPADLGPRLDRRHRVL